MQKLEFSSGLATDWFENDYIILNTDKCQFLISGINLEHALFELSAVKIWENDSVKLLGITANNELKVSNPVLKICPNENQKLTAILRMKRNYYLHKEHILLKALVESQFKYFPKVGMFHEKIQMARQISHSNAL